MKAKPTTGKLLSFEDITPSEKLEWHPCFMEPYKCARLTVPMDYHRPLNASKDNPKVHIALLLVPGKHTESKVSKSPMLLNPGGPGGSGTSFALIVGERIQSIVGYDQDIIGFDPRGIAATTPRADCFSYPYEDSEITEEEDYARGNFHRMLWQNAGRTIGIVNSSSASLQKLDTRARTIAKLCEEKDSLHQNESIFKYAHTPSVARDMISIIDAWDDWAESLTADNSAEEPEELIPEAAYDEEARSQSPDTKGKLVYWGFSYGTLLGATFAAMFPDRVGRVVLDGVVDANHYVAPVWTESIQDADTIFLSFGRYCYEAESKCALYRPGDKAKDIQKRLEDVMEDLENNPIMSIDPVTKSPVVIGNSDFRMLIFSILYSPTYGFPTVAFCSNLIYIGQGELLGQLLSPAYVQDLKPVCSSSLPFWMFPNEAQVAIMCSDKRYPFNETLPDLEVRFEKMANISSWADVWMTVMLGCEGWKIEAVDPPMRWDDHPAHKQKPIKTSHPLLFISNTADPVTPLKAGIEMSKKFLNAGLIEQQSEGHCSLAAVSKCTINKVRAYFITGEVPPPPVETGKQWRDGKWVKCVADEWPFHPYDGREFLAQRGIEVAADAKRMTAAKEMQDNFGKFLFWGQDASSQNLVGKLQSNILKYQSYDVCRD